MTRRVVQLFAGLTLYGVSMALMVRAGLGLDPWDVFHQGVSEVTGLSFGTVVILTCVPVLLLWIPLRQRPGFGTIANAIVIGLVVDGTLLLLPVAQGWPLRITFLVAGIVLNGVATGMYLGARFGPGPRDGLMTGLVARFPRLRVGWVRTGIEVTVLGVGLLLGGTAGIGTIAYALGIGPLVHLFLPVFSTQPSVAGRRPSVGERSARPVNPAEMSDPVTAH